MRTKHTLLVCTAHLRLHLALQDLCQSPALLQVTVVDAQRILSNLNSGDLLADRRLAATEEDQRTVPQLLTKQIEFADVLVRQLEYSVVNESSSVCLTSDGWHVELCCCGDCCS